MVNVRQLLVIVAAVAASLTPRSPQVMAEASKLEESANEKSLETRLSVAKPLPGVVDVAAFRLREGAQLINELGRFRLSGDSLTFIDGADREIGGLPNLNLERIIRMLKSVEEPESVWWSVSGVITEFSDRNYILINRAVYKTAAPPPTPESLPVAGPAPPEKLAP